MGRRGRLWCLRRLELSEDATSRACFNLRRAKCLRELRVKRTRAVVLREHDCRLQSLFEVSRSCKHASSPAQINHVTSTLSLSKIHLLREDELFKRSVTTHRSNASPRDNSSV
jgi:hypothetical protein